MDVRDIEPRTSLWALAEISWEDPGGTPQRAPATLEDTSRSGACLRVQRPFSVGSRVTIKWSREQFCAVARNCRSDGRDYLIGVLREAHIAQAQPAAPSSRGQRMESRSKIPAGLENAGWQPTRKNCQSLF